MNTLTRSILAALLLSALGCHADVEDATQVVVVIDSDLAAADQLLKVRVEVLPFPGEPGSNTGFPDVFLAKPGEAPRDAGRKTLPLSLSVTPGRARKVLVRVVGWGALSAGEPVRALVEQRAVVAFRAQKTQLVRIFLGEVCVDQDCGGDPARVCYPSERADLAVARAGECGPLAALSEAETKPDVAPEDLPSLVQEREDAAAPTHTDAPDAASVLADTGTDARVEPAPGEADAMAPELPRSACSALTCEHGGQCVEQDGSARCDCGATDYWGQRCENPTADCGSAHCPADYPCTPSLGRGYTCLGRLADWPMPDSTPGAARAPSFDTSTPGLATDRVTQLHWQREVPALYPGCSGNEASAGDSCTRSEAEAYCAQLSMGSLDDFRLPSKIELASLLDESFYDPTIDPQVFPGTPGVWFWTSSTNVENTAFGWAESFGFGGTGYLPLTNTEKVRCVRGTPNVSGPPEARYVVAAETVTDVHTGLVWRRTVEPGRYTWTEALRRCQAPFRLPTYKEALTLVDPARLNPATDPHFRGETSDVDTPAEVYWTSSVNLARAETAWDVDLRNGANSGDGLQASARRVRCVR